LGKRLIDGGLWDARGRLDSERLHQQVADVDLFPGIVAKTDALAYIPVPLLLTGRPAAGRTARFMRVTTFVMHQWNLSVKLGLSTKEAV